jgi:uncharacterized lipoprotein YmbA
MNVGRYRLFALTLVVFAMTGLAGCLGGSSPAVRFYVLSPITETPATDPEKPLAIEISSVHLPQYLDRPHLVTRSGNNRLKILQSHQWGGNLRKDMLRTLAVNLSQLLNTPNVTIASHRSTALGDYRISIEIIKFEKDTDNHVRLSAQWQITTGIELKPLITEITTLSSDSPATEDNYDEVVAMMSEQYAELAKIIASAIQNLESK